MVLIRLKAPFVSVIVTVLSTLSELALLSFLFELNNLHECRRLQSGGKVRIHRHILRTRIISLVSLAAFFALEVVFSFYNDPVNNIVLETQECITVSNSVQESGASTSSLRASDIFVECRKLDNGTITQFGGNFSRQTQQVECSPEKMYTHPIGNEETEESVAGAPFGCVPNEQGEACVFVRQDGNVSRISAPFFRDDLERGSLPETLPHIKTELHFKPPSNVSLFSSRALGAFLQGIQGPSAVRRITYSGAREANCTFPVVRGSATSLPLAMIISLAAVWAATFLIFLSIFWLRKSVFFKLSSPMDWATRSVRPADDPLGEDPVLTRLVENGRTMVEVSTSSGKE